VSTAVKKNFEVSFQKQISCTEPNENPQLLLTEYDDLIERLKTKCSTSTKEDKIMKKKMNYFPCGK
jgi:hypothetical protein